MIVQEILNLLTDKFPLSLQEQWDNSGLLFPNSKKRSVGSILLSMDISKEVINYAISKKVNLIISHHPIIDKTTMINKGRMALLKTSGISHIAMHTNYDNSPEGMNLALIKRTKVPRYEQNEKTKAYIGFLNRPLTARKFANMLKRNLGCKQVYVYESRKDHKVGKFAIIGGNGTSYLESVSTLGVDAFVTGDLKWHSWNECNELGMSCFDVGHDQERAFIIEINKLLKSQFHGKILTYFPIDRTKIVK